MYWLYFVRDVCRVAQASQAIAVAPKHSPLRAQPVAVVYAPIEKAKKKAKPPAPTSPPQAPSAGYLQRLSVEGEHAFGVWDEGCGFSLFSANFERVTQLNAGDCAGHDWIHAIHHRDQYAINELLLHAIEGADGQCLVQARHGAGDAWRWLLIDARAPNAHQPGVMVLWRDISEQKALEEALKHTEATLALSERGRDAFLSGMSHELRTPLNAIMGFSAMMKDGVLGPLPHATYQEYAEHIHDSGATLLAKISGLLDIASMDSGSLDLEEEEFSLADLFAELGEIHSHPAFARDQKLTLDCPAPFHLRADRSKLLCALSHFASNALRHSADGAEIVVSARVQPGDGIVLSVRDHGEGIATPQLAAIRNALTAEDAKLAVAPGAIGIGLALANELVSRHGGRITVDSIRRRGTVIAMLLPLERVTKGIRARKSALPERFRFVE